MEQKLNESQRSEILDLWDLFNFYSITNETKNSLKVAIDVDNLGANGDIFFIFSAPG
jgi:hypothetical protein